MYLAQKLTTVGKTSPFMGLLAAAAVTLIGLRPDAISSAGPDSILGTSSQSTAIFKSERVFARKYFELWRREDTVAFDPFSGQFRLGPRVIDGIDERYPKLVSDIRVDKPTQSGPTIEHYLYVSAGWPFPTLEGERVWVAGNANPIINYGISTTTRTDLFGLELPRSGPKPVKIGRNPNDSDLPSSPVWWGIALNTLVFASLYFAVVGGFHAIRVFLRMRRGHCPRCSYDLLHRLDATCPECGWNRTTI